MENRDSLLPSTRYMTINVTQVRSQQALLRAAREEQAGAPRPLTAQIEPG